MAYTGRFAFAQFPARWRAAVGTYNDPRPAFDTIADAPFLPPPNAPAVPQPNNALQQVAQQAQQAGLGGMFSSEGGARPDDGYGQAVSLGSFLSSVVPMALGMTSGPLGALVSAGMMIGSMIADPTRAAPFGLMAPVMGVLGLNDITDPSVAAARGGELGGWGAYSQQRADIDAAMYAGDPSATRGDDLGGWGAYSQQQADIDAAMYAGDPSAAQWGGFGLFN